MSDDNEVKGTRGFIVTTEPTKEAKDLVAQYLRDKNNELRQFQAGTDQEVPGYGSGRTQRNTLDTSSRRKDESNPMLTKGVQGYKRAGMNPGEAEIAQREKYTYRGPVSQDASISDDDYVTSLYNKYLGRDPDAEGFKYWKTLAGGDPTRRGKIESDFLKSQEAIEKRDARIGGARSFISDEFLDLFSKTGSGVKYGDYLQDKDDMDSVVDSDPGDSSTLNLKSLSDTYKDYLDEDDSGSAGDFLENYLANLA